MPLLEEVLSPPWTSDWLTRRDGESSQPSASRRRRRWRARGRLRGPPPWLSALRQLPRERVSEFGSTPCKAHYRCSACLEPFDYFKCICERTC